MQAYMLTGKQVWRRSLFLATAASCVGGYFFYQHSYIHKKLQVFNLEYQMMKNSPEYFQQLHQQVALGGTQEQEENEKQLNIPKLRRKLIQPHAQGIVLETCIGTNPNRKFYPEDKITKIIGIDWVDMSVAQAKQKVVDGGKILLLERGKAAWLEDNFELMRKASLNLGARGQIYHHDFE